MVDEVLRTSMSSGYQTLAATCSQAALINMALIHEVNNRVTASKTTGRYKPVVGPLRGALSWVGTGLKIYDFTIYDTVPFAPPPPKIAHRDMGQRRYRCVSQERNADRSPRESGGAQESHHAKPESP